MTKQKLYPITRVFITANILVAVYRCLRNFYLSWKIIYSIF